MPLLISLSLKQDPVALFPASGISSEAWKSRLFSRGVRRPYTKRGRKKLVTKISAMTRIYPWTLTIVGTEKAIRVRSTVWLTYVFFDIYFFLIFVSWHSPIVGWQCRDLIRFSESLLTAPSFTSSFRSTWSQIQVNWFWVWTVWCHLLNYSSTWHKWKQKI